MPTQQQFSTMDAVELKVQAPWSGLPNLVPNPRGVNGTWGWRASSGVGLTSTGSSLVVTGTGMPAMLRSDRAQVPTVTASGTRARAWVTVLEVTDLAPDPLAFRIQYFDADRDLISQSSQTAVPAGGSGVYQIASAAVPIGTAYVQLVLEPSTGYPATFTDVVLIVGPATQVNGATPQVEQAWVDVLGPTHDLTIERDELNVGTLVANILDSSLDPARSGLIRPGHKVRLCRTGAVDGDCLFIGRILNGRATYDYTQPDDAKRTRIQLTATDNLTPLANTPRSEGVATIDELPYVLEGAGVAWNVNGSSGAIDADDVTVVAVNENASAVDQVAITRDTALGYAWLDRCGVLQAWDNDQIPTTVAADLDENDYSAFDVDFDTDRCINTVTIKVVRINPGTGETEETAYGPWIDEDSVRQWGAHSAEFTVYAMGEAALDAYAAVILAANATPTVRVNAVTLPIATLGEVETKAGLDLYDLVNIRNTDAGIDEASRIVSVKHRISAGPTVGQCRWYVDLGFAADNSVAPPQQTPSPGPGGGKTLGQLLRPVGEITQVYGTPSMIADEYPGWLICNGAAYDTAQYPRLHAWLQRMVDAGLHTNAAVLPNFVDRFIIGAGEKAAGSSGGASTRKLTAANLPQHQHEITARQGATGFGTALSVARPSATGTVANLATGNTGSADPEPVDIMPPWRAAYVIIRAA